MIDYSDTHEDEVTLVSLTLLVRSHVWTVTAIFVISVVLLIGISFLIPPKYESTAVLMPVEDNTDSPLSSLLGSQLGGLASLGGLGAMNSGTNKEKALAILTSQAFTAAFIEDFGLLPELFPRKWDAARERWKSDDDIPTIQDGVEKFEEDIRSLDVDGKSGLVRLTILWRDREKAALWAAALVDRVNASLREEAILEANKSIEFLQEELESTTFVDVRQAIFELISSNVQQIMLANVREEYVFRVIDPPVVADDDKYVVPNHILFAILGFVMGMTLVASYLYMVRFSKQVRSALQESAERDIDHG